MAARLSPAAIADAIAVGWAYSETLAPTGTAGVSKLAKAVHGRAARADPSTVIKATGGDTPPRRHVNLRRRPSERE